MIYFEYGGGLGDVINQIFRSCSYQCLETLDGMDRATIGLICHNIHVKEIFENHPKRDFFEAKLVPYFHGVPNETSVRMEHGIDLPVNFPQRCDLPITFYNLESDAEFVNKLAGKKYVVLLPNAGQSDRSFSQEMFQEICEFILEKTPDLNIVYIDRTYERVLRINVKYSDFENERFYNFCDLVSVPATINLIKASSGVISAHSSMILPTWHYNIPNVCLFPEHIRHRHFAKGDEWSFGQNNIGSFCGTFGQESELLQGFLNHIQAYG